VLIRPDVERRIGWRARYRDPDSGRLVKVTLDPALRTAELRIEWAARKARSLDRRRLELEQGAPRATGTTLEAAIARYYGAHAQLRPSTLLAYKAATNKLLAWADAEGIKSCDDLTRAQLLGFREELIAEPKQRVAAGAKRGGRKASRQRRSAASVNRELRGVRVVLGYLNDLDLFPRMSEGDLRRACKKLPVAVERADYLKPPEIKALLEAALAHDEETFTRTRAEHAGLLPVGSTARFRSIAPFVAFVLLAGTRKSEAIDLEWSSVDLDAKDERGQLVGEVHLTSATKTHRARTVDLAVSPALGRVLAALQKAGGKGSVLGVTRDAAAAAMLRLRELGAPSGFGWQTLRRTCATYLVNSPGIFGAASAYRSARQLGHSIAVSEKHYLGLLRGIPPDANTLEAAMGVEELLGRVVQAIEYRGVSASSETLPRPRAT
jgi:integrase